MMTMKRKLKQLLKRILLKTVWRYDAAKLQAKLKEAGIQQGDCVMVHSTWRPDNGFDGSAKDFIDALKSLIGENGLLVMMSMPYNNQTTQDYLRQQKVFKIRRTPSRVGLLTEVFRRGKDVVRSHNAAHPLLVWGKGKEAFIEGHEHSKCSFGTDSPFARLANLNCKFLLVDTPFNSTTYNHYLEAVYEDRFPVPLFEEQPMSGVMEDADGSRMTFSTLVLSKQSVPYRIDHLLEGALEKKGAVRRFRIGATHFIKVNARDSEKVSARSVIFYC